MKRGIKSKITIRLFGIMFIILVSYILVLYYYSVPILQNNVVKYGIYESQKNLAQIETAINDIYELSEFLLLNESIRTFLNKNDFKTVSEKIVELNGLMNSLKKNILLKNYIHSFSIISNDGSCYWSVCPYDNFFIDWFHQHAVDKSQLDNSLGFTGRYIFPSKTSFNTKINLVSYITNINAINKGKFEFLGKVLVNVEINKLMDDVFLKSSIFDQIVILDANNDIIYISSDGGNRLPLWNNIQNLKYPYEKLEDGYYFINEISSCGWKIVSFLSNQHVKRLTDFPILTPAVIIMISALCLLLVFISPELLKITEQIIKLESAIRAMAEGDLDVSVSLAGAKELVNISDGFNYMVSKIKQYMKESLDNLRAKQKVSFELLLAKINPHFIYNTLNSIIYLARKNKNEDIIKLTSAFIYLLQDSIKLDEQNFFERIETELEVVDKYITIQKYRYADRFTYSCTFDPELEGALIPKNILQPIVENSIIHGICPKQSQSSIKLIATKIDNTVKIVISDDGVGMDQKKADELLSEDPSKDLDDSRSKMRPIGIRNVLEKLQFAYGTEYKFKINSRPNTGTSISITIPFSKEAAF